MESNSIQTDTMNGSNELILRLDGSRKKYILNQDHNVAGRGEECDLNLPTKTVARRHAEFTRLDNAWFVKDLGSKNGIILNGKRLEPFEERRLSSGDRLMLGGMEFRVETDDKEAVAGQGRNLLFYILAGVVILACLVVIFVVIKIWKENSLRTTEKTVAAKEEAAVEETAEEPVMEAAEEETAEEGGNEEKMEDSEPKTQMISQTVIQETSEVPDAGPVEETVSSRVESELDKQIYSAITIHWESSGLEDHAMDWQDEGLEKAVREALGKKEGVIMLRDVFGLTDLNAAGYDIENVDALGELVNLTRLDLHQNRIRKVDVLKNLPNLRQLSLSENRIQEISAFNNKLTDRKSVV